MFEKESEERFKKKPLGYEMKPELEIYTDGFKDGYNKAKEEDKWHKVHIMEGFVDLPDEERTYLCCLQDGDEYMYEVLDICIDGNGGCYLSSMVWTIDELIAWKEITPPKED